jgi:hypothetical protein
MKGRMVWFVAGSAAGVYAAAKAKRAAYRLSMPGLVDQSAALGLGWRAFRSELRDGMETREREVAHELSGATPLDHLSPGHDDQLEAGSRGPASRPAAFSSVDGEHRSTSLLGLAGSGADAALPDRPPVDRHDREPHHYKLADKDHP